MQTFQPVGLSNILDNEFRWGTPAKWPHGKVVGAAVVDGELLCKVIQGIKAVAGIKPFLVLPVAALHFAVVTWHIGTDELVEDAELCGGSLKQGGQVPLAVGEAVGEFKHVVRLDALHPYAPACIPLLQLFQEVGGGVGTLFRVGGQEAQAGELVDGGILEQAKSGVCDTPAGHCLCIHLDPLAGIGHLLIKLGTVGFFLLCCGEQAQFSQKAEQALRAAGIAPLAQPVPQFHHTQVRITAAHIPDQLQLCLCVLVGMTVRASGLAAQGLHCSVPTGLPEVDIRPALVVLPAGPADTVFLCVFHQGLPIRHVLCYTLVHEG